MLAIEMRCRLKELDAERLLASVEGAAEDSAYMAMEKLHELFGPQVG